LRTWITGIGLATSLGVGAAETFRKLLSGERGLGEIDLFDTKGQRATLGAQIRGVPVPEGDVWSRASAFAKLAAAEALAQAGVDPRRARVGLVVGGTTAGMFENEVDVAAMQSGASPLGPKGSLRSHPLSSTPDALDASIGPFARLRSVASACSSGAAALVLARAWLLEDETLDAVVAGGTDGLCRLTLSGFNALAAIDPEPCRPFDRTRRGLNLGEGAGFLVLERATNARRRNRSPIAELAGGALAAEAHHITNPESEGTTPARVMREAIERAGLTPADIDYVNAHGTATPLNDAMEAKALARVLGAEVSRVWVSSSKAQIGHTLAAAGAIEAAISALVVAEGTLPPTVGLADVDPACEMLRHVRETVRLPKVRAVLSNSFGFGGMDAALVLTSPELARDPVASRREVFVSAASALTPRGLGDASAHTMGAASAGEVPDAATSLLETAKARRFDRSARLCAATAKAVMDEAAGVDRARCGVVFGSAFSAVDESAAFVQRIFEKGPRLASPADFPNLVPSSPVGHASIYEALRGPALATADLRASGESAVLTALELLAAGEADAFVAGAVGVRSRLIDNAFYPLFDDHTTAAPRTECCAAVLLRAGSATGALARVAGAWTFREGEPLAVPPPGASAVVIGAVSARALAAVTASSAWRDVPVRTTEPGAGSNEAAGAVAIGAAARAVAAREVEQALVVGVRSGWRVAILLTRPG